AHKAWITSNGLDLERVQQGAAKTEWSCIYASNYTRGLVHLLRLWPKMRKRFPLLTLDVYYGWPKWDTPVPEIVSLLERLTQPGEGVRDHGRVGHSTLARAFARAEFWTYPTDFDETFCITALKAQAANAIPVIVRRGALKEVVAEG